MLKYLFRRILLFIPTMIGVSMAIFALLRVIPGDVAAVILAGPSGEGTYTQEDLSRLRHELGLDKPIYVQYISWMKDVSTGHLGNSVALNRPIWGELKRQFPVTLQLAL